MQTAEKMSATVLKNIKGSDFPAAWRGRIKVNPAQTFTVTVTLEHEEVMPPEDQISDKFIQAVKESEKSIKAGKGTFHRTVEDLFKYLEKV